MAERTERKTNSLDVRIQSLLKKDLIFTNQVSGIATLYVHMGYGGVASTGEFTNIRLEFIQ